MMPTISFDAPRRRLPPANQNLRSQRGLPPIRGRPRIPRRPFRRGKDGRQFVSCLLAVAALLLAASLYFDPTTQPEKGSHHGRTDTVQK